MRLAASTVKTIDIFFFTTKFIVYKSHKECEKLLGKNNSIHERW